jgi:hypothetical protein
MQKKQAGTPYTISYNRIFIAIALPDLMARSVLNEPAGSADSPLMKYIYVLFS